MPLAALWVKAAEIIKIKNMRQDKCPPVEKQMRLLFAESGMSGWHVRKIVGAKIFDRTVPLAQLENSIPMC